MLELLAQANTFVSFCILYKRKSAVCCPHWWDAEVQHVFQSSGLGEDARAALHQQCELYACGNDEVGVLPVDGSEERNGEHAARAPQTRQRRASWRNHTEQRQLPFYPPVQLQMRLLLSHVEDVLRLAFRGSQKRAKTPERSRWVNLLLSAEI